MKIAFLCGSLEPGRDGVGDYVRRLAGELAQQGHQVAGVALNDHYTAQEVSAPPARPTGLHVLRLPAAWPAAQRFGRAKQWLDDFGAEWLSLQFVPFSFHPKGLPFGLGKALAPLGQGRTWHLMVHELWVGMDREAPVKYVWWGRMQRYLIGLLIARINPKVIHTQTHLYQAQLAKMGLASEYLSLFSNIADVPPVAGATPGGLGKHPSKTVSLVVFGSIHPGAPVEQLAKDAASYARATGASVVLTLVGRCGAEQAHWVAAWQDAGLPVEVLGEQEPARISEVLRSASLGVATTPVVLIGKSGTAAAMQEHGLPVLCVARPWYPRGMAPLEMPPGAMLYEPGNFEKYLVKAGPLAPSNRAAGIARQLAGALVVAAPGTSSADR